MSDINLDNNDNNIDNNIDKDLKDKLDCEALENKDADLSSVEEQDISMLCKEEEKEDAVLTATAKSPKGFFRSLLEQIELVVVALAAIILIFTFVGRTCRVNGESMENTLHHNELVITTNLFYTPERGDIVVFHQTGSVYNEPIVKRIIGLPGDTVKIEYFPNNMQVTVTYPDGTIEVLDEDYMKYEKQTYSNMTVTVKEGTVFAMGDNRSHSADSRSSAIGLIDQRRILGKVVWRVTPFSRFGKIE